MAITPADIEQLSFSESKHGYDTEEVDTALEQIAQEVDAMLNKIADLKNRLNSAEQQLAQSQGEVARLQSEAAAPVAAPEPVSAANDLNASEAQISRVLIVAQQSADKMVSDARDSAERIRNDADQKAREVIRQALAEKQAELDEIDRLKQSREDFRSEYRKLLQHFMEDMEATFPEQQVLGSTGSYSAPASTPAVDADATVYSAPVAQDLSGFGDLD